MFLWVASLTFPAPRTDFPTTESYVYDDRALRNSSAYEYFELDFFLRPHSE